MFLLPSGPKRTFTGNLKSFLRESSNTSDPIGFLIALQYHWAGPFWNISSPPIYDFKNGRGNWRHSEGTGLQRVVWGR